ncbi:putative nuclease HARBI1 [Topomyia yanbarensis]|uniref:putative nuclease HARBI1 n=1 Tax=Topomyia yanbarensis TaxID=2498891 RepID=UPI00273B8FB6|nr:putative nuclease HARBI1 [Topomyia yanbarensis]
MLNFTRICHNMLSIKGYSSKMFFSDVFLFNIPNEEEHRQIKFYRRSLRDSSNPLELPEELFLRRYRVNKEVFVYLHTQLHLPNGARCTFIPPILQLATTLQLLGGGSYQWQVGVDFVAPMSQSTVHYVTTSVIKEMESAFCKKWIRFKISNVTKQFFYAKYRIPSVIGCIDGTHIMMLRPQQNEHMFFNRKGKHSINAMIICNETLEIMSVNAKYGGCAHDSFVWQQSKERAMLETEYDKGMRNIWLLGMIKCLL